MEKIENKEYCAKCGGYCCKKCGCDYVPSDFDDLSFNGLLNTLNEGHISVVALLDFKEIQNRSFVVPLLYLRARNVDREIIDLLSFKTTCSMLREDGCAYDYNQRPSGGKNLIPAEERFLCRPKNDPLEMVKAWASYQKSFIRLVKRFTGLSVEAKLKEDARTLFYNYMIDNYKEAAIEEIEDVKGMLPHLMRVYPDEFRAAYQEASKTVPTNVLNRTLNKK